MNTTPETAIIKNALTLITVKYVDHVKSNPNLPALMTNPNVVVNFKDQTVFETNLALTSKPKVGCRVNGFTDYMHGKPIVYINRASYTPATVIHELLHFLSHPDFNKGFKPEVVEGVTEYFTRKVQGRATDNFAQFRVDRTGIYDTELDDVTVARSLIKGNAMKDVRSAYMKRAYFFGDKDAIQLLKSITG
jgi:hypothetical protein